ncbi:MAG TPA: peptidoglycan-associated lipoprotein, partial [Caulobacteraceae bacterium]|nr:peptidoglycan-associated lipoprotein [Caulobacteraceae bacterium]
MSLKPSRLTQLSVVLVTTLAMAACSSPKKPLPITTATAPTQPPVQSQPPRAPTQPPPVQSRPNQGPTGPAPGSAQDFVVNAGERVFFDYDSSAIRADAQPILDAQAAWLNRYPAVKVRIE